MDRIDVMILLKEATMEKSTPTLNKVIKIDKQHYLADADLRGTPDGAARCPGRSRMRYQDQEHQE